MWENLPFFRVDMAGLRKYCTGGCGRLGSIGITEAYTRSIACHLLGTLVACSVESISCIRFVYKNALILSVGNFPQLGRRLVWLKKEIFILKKSCLFCFFSQE